MYYQLESTAERRKRKYQDIKTLFQQLTVEEEGFSFMDAYEAVGYQFYESATTIRRTRSWTRRNCNFVVCSKPISPPRRSTCSLVKVSRHLSAQDPSPSETLPCRSRRHHNCYHITRYNNFSRYAEILLYFFSILNVYLIMLKMLHPCSAIYKTRILYFINIGQYMTILESK